MPKCRVRTANQLALFAQPRLLSMQTILPPRISPSRIPPVQLGRRWRFALMAIELLFAIADFLAGRTPSSQTAGGTTSKAVTLRDMSILFLAARPAGLRNAAFVVCATDISPPHPRPQTSPSVLYF